MRLFPFWRREWDSPACGRSGGAGKPAPGSFSDTRPSNPTIYLYEEKQMDKKSICFSWRREWDSIPPKHRNAMLDPSLRDGTWVLGTTPQHKKEKSRRCDFSLFGAGSGIRTHAGCPKRFSRPPRYDHFAIPAYAQHRYLITNAKKCQVRKKIFFALCEKIDTHALKVVQYKVEKQFSFFSKER